jgi:hypothetical protein
MRKLEPYYLDDYGLTYSKFLKLKKSVRVKIHLTYPKYEKFYIYSPKDRRKKINEVLQKEYDNLVKILPHRNFKKGVTEKGIRSITIELPASSLKVFENKKFIESIWIEHIPGLKKKKNKKEKLWYAVKAIFLIQIEGLKGGMQTYEERIIIVKAYSFEDAGKVAEKEFKEYGDDPYLNPAMLMVRWHYEKIVDIFETNIYQDKLDEKGTEVYSILKTRKLKPEHEWHPIKKYKKA